MEQSDFDKVQSGLSRDRLRVYMTPGDSHADVLAKYLWNMTLCESLYPALNLLEIGVRNSVHHTMSLRHGAFWFDGGCLPLNGYQKDCVQIAKNELVKRHRPVSAGAVVAEVSFGFWVSLFERHLDRSWRGLLKNAFPNARPANRNVPHIRKTLDPLRRFRNRVFHHERILHCSPSNQHAECRIVIGWLGGDLLALFDGVDRYPNTYAHGLEHAKSLVASIYPELEKTVEEERDCDTENPTPPTP